MSLIDLKGASDVAIKFLDMVEKSIGWAVAPKGSRKDFYDGLEIYKKSIKNDQFLSEKEKAIKISLATRDFRQYINQAKIVEFAKSDINQDADFKNIDPDWLAFFFEYAKNISKEEAQLIWAKLLANRVNGERQVSKKLIHILAIIEDDDIDVFCKICSMTFDSENRKNFKYPFIYIGNFPSYYNSINIRRYHLRSLADLGLIEYDITNGFVLPEKVPILKYGDTKIKLSSNDRINTGDIRLTATGRTLYDMTERKYRKDFIEQCKRIWKALNVKYEHV